MAIFRDLDSRPSQREVNAVNEWLQSKHPFHVMRDHPGHDLPMLAGMWGIKLEENVRPILRKVFLASLKQSMMYWDVLEDTQTGE